mmetsp:Transcript_13139/g.16022  ORF Transcript_13139/g.16022 Transcript_13139/m.16022 type:complete len:129 (+) Transcript_13139:530-916(+)
MAILTLTGGTAVQQRFSYYEEGSASQFFKPVTSTSRPTTTTNCSYQGDYTASESENSEHDSDEYDVDVDALLRSVDNDTDDGSEDHDHATSLQAKFTNFLQEHAGLGPGGYLVETKCFLDGTAGQILA